MKRRAAVAAIAAFAAWPRVAMSQRVYRISTLVHGPEKAWSTRIAALKAGLKEHGYVEGRNYVLVSRWNEAGLERLSELAAELLREKPDIVVCAPALTAAAVHKHSSTVPIVQGNGAGAVKIGLAKSFARPGGNVTGLETQSEDLTAKHMELLKTVAPKISRLAMLNTGKYLFHEEAWQAAKLAAPALKLELVDVRVSAPSELAKLASACGKGGCNALYVMPDPDLNNWRAEIIAMAARLKLPAVYIQPEFAQEGGLISYSANFEDLWRRAAGYIDRILKGAKPGDLPIERPTRFEMVINLKTAKALGLTIPPSVAARADQVIQ